MRIYKPLFPLFLFLFLSLGLQAQPIRTYMDLQTHPTMHILYSFFGDGFQSFDPENPPELSYKHQFKNVIFENYLRDNPGARIICTGAIAPEIGASRKRAWAVVLKQIRTINAFAEAHPDDFVVAKTPQEVRDYVHNTDKTVIIHSIEGAKKLVRSAEDARFWADQGVAFMTLIHLVDDEYGGAAIRPGLATEVINYKGSIRRKFHKQKPRGLTDEGRQAIQYLADAGIMTDLTHMSDDSRKDALTYMEAHGITPIVTHDMFKPIQNHPRGIHRADVIRIYKLGGFMSLPISGISTTAFASEAAIKAELDSLEAAGCFCPGSIDSYKYTYEKLQGFVEGNVAAIMGPTVGPFEELTEAEKERLCIGFQSDFNGWLDHSRPRYGEDGCFEVEEGKEYEAIELYGMQHPGHLMSQWNWMEKNGVDLEPVR
ncbi:MAG: membrane dipeptidase, partial [Bacteroidota bacterium]